MGEFDISPLGPGGDDGGVGCGDGRGDDGGDGGGDDGGVGGWDGGGDDDGVGGVGIERRGV